MKISSVMPVSGPPSAWSGQLILPWYGSRLRLLSPWLMFITFVVVTLGMGPGVIWGDTVQYIRIGHELNGMDPGAAWEIAFRTYCTNPSLGFNGTIDECLNRALAGKAIVGWIDRHPPYAAIFTPRIGYPLLANTLVPLVGERIAFWLVALAATALAGVLVYALASKAGLGRGAVLAQAFFYTLPVGIPHGIALLAEATTVLASLVMVLGFGLIYHRQRGGVPLLILGLALVFFFKYSSTGLLSLSLVIVAILGWLMHRRNPGMAPLRALLAAIVAFILSLAINKFMGFPGLSESLQDTFTLHFSQPPVPDPFRRLVALELDYAQRFITALTHNYGWLIVFVAGTIGFIGALRKVRAPGFLLGALAVSLYGLLSVVGHPVFSQGPRLGSSIWLVIALGLAYLPHALAAWQRRRRTGAGRNGVVLKDHG